MDLAQALRLKPSPHLQNTSAYSDSLGGVAFVGAGGKTSALFTSAQQLLPPVVVTTTTHMGNWQVSQASQHFVITKDEDLNAVEDHRRGLMLVTGTGKGDRFGPLTEKQLDWLHNFCGYYSLPLLLEADGSRQRPLKAPAEHEPPIPDFVQTVVVVAGLSGLGQPLDADHIHRPEIFAQRSGLALGQPITVEALANVLTNPQGGLKNIPARARRVALLNQADTPELQAQGKLLAEALLPTFNTVVISSLQPPIPDGSDARQKTYQAASVFAAHEPAAGIILAAGESARFGQPKQLLDWHGQPFVRAVAQTALRAGLEPVVVVTGSCADRVEAALKDLPVKIVHNAEWKAGQSTSIRAGLSPLTSGMAPWKEGQKRVGSAIFLLADQPQVTPAVLRALVDQHASELPTILAPMVEDRRANPVLFDQVSFPDLLALTGDTGGRGIFWKYKVEYLPWHDSALLLDVDTPTDYERLKERLP
jgi:molybdenum cofactor cytidylyltransferase